MNLENYKYFAAAEELNFTQAAKKLYVTQQALSKQVDKIEKFYNARLFNREPPMSLTPAGECLYRHVCRIMDDERQMRSELNSLLNISSRRLIIGVSYYRSSALPRALAAEYFSPHQLHEMQAAEEVSLSVFAHCPFIRLSSDTWLGSHFDRCCEKEQLTPRIAVDSSSVLTILNCCVEGVGAALIPNMYLTQLTKEQRSKLYLFRWDYSDVRCEKNVVCAKREKSV